MPTNTTLTPDGTDEKAVTAALATHPDGTTAAALATDTGLTEPTVRRILDGLVDSGAATRTPGTGRGKQRTPDTWTPTADASGQPVLTGADDSTAADPTPANEQDASPATEQATSAPEPDTREASADAPVSPAPVGNGDQLKLAMVAEVMSEHPDGVTAADICDESGLRGQIISRVLGAMEAAGAATRASSPRSSHRSRRLSPTPTTAEPRGDARTAIWSVAGGHTRERVRTPPPATSPHWTRQQALIPSPHLIRGDVRRGYDQMRRRESLGLSKAVDHHRFARTANYRLPSCSRLTMEILARWPHLSVE